MSNLFECGGLNKRIATGVANITQETITNEDGSTETVNRAVVDLGFKPSKISYSGKHYSAGTSYETLYVFGGFYDADNNKTEMVRMRVYRSIGSTGSNLGKNYDMTDAGSIIITDTGFEIRTNMSAKNIILEANYIATE